MAMKQQQSTNSNDCNKTSKNSSMELKNKTKPSTLFSTIKGPGESYDQNEESQDSPVKNKQKLLKHSELEEFKLIEESLVKDTSNPSPTSKKLFKLQNKIITSSEVNNVVQMNVNQNKINKGQNIRIQTSEGYNNLSKGSNNMTPQSCQGDGSQTVRGDMLKLQ